MALPTGLFLKVLDYITRIGSDTLTIFNAPTARGTGVLVDNAITKIAAERGITRVAAGKLLGENLVKALVKLNVPKIAAEQVLGKTAAAELGLAGADLGVAAAAAETGILAAAAETILPVIVISVLIYLAGALFEYIRTEALPFTFESLFGHAKVIIDQHTLETSAAQIAAAKLQPLSSTPAQPIQRVPRAHRTSITQGHRRVTQLRLDVVAFRSETDADVIEVKGRAMPGSIGEVLTYLTLWREKHPGITARGVIVANNVHPDVRKIADQYGIVVIEV